VGEPSSCLCAQVVYTGRDKHAIENRRGGHDALGLLWWGAIIMTVCAGGMHRQALLTCIRGKKGLQMRKGRAHSYLGLA